MLKSVPIGYTTAVLLAMEIRKFDKMAKTSYPLFRPSRSLGPDLQDHVKVLQVLESR